MAETDIAGFVRGFLDHLNVERGLSAHTTNAYRRDLGRYADFLAQQQISSPAEIRPEHISQFVISLRTGSADHPALAPASVARAVVAIRSLHRFGVQEQITIDNPATRTQPPATSRRLPKALSLDEVQRLLDTADPATPLGLRDAALLELLYGTGARISELTVLDVDDVSRLLAGSDTVPGSDPARGSTTGLRLFGKGSKERIVPLGSFARSAVQAWLVRGRPILAERARAPSPALLLNARGGRLSRQSAWTILRTAAARAEIDADVSPHTLRHSFATHLLDGGADVRVVQELLGHASVTTTQIYTLVTVDHLREVYLTAHPRAY